MTDSLHIIINFLNFTFSQKFWIRIININLFRNFFMTIFQMNIWLISFSVLLDTIPMMFFFFRKFSIYNAFVILYFLYQFPIILFNILKSFLFFFICNGKINSIINILFKFFFFFSLKSIDYFNLIIKLLQVYLILFVIFVYLLWVDIIEWNWLLLSKIYIFFII